jgi:hypothetical protein
MKRSVVTIGVLFMLLAGACAPQAVPTTEPLDIQHTAEAAAFTMVAETEQAAPTATSVPPTSTASLTPRATNTHLPLPTSGTAQLLPTNLATLTPVVPQVQATAGIVQTLPANAPTFTPLAPQAQATSGSGNNQDLCNQPLTSWQGPTANFSIANQTRPEGTIVLSMYVVTEMGQCGYLIINGSSFSGPVGQYSAGAFITGKQNFKAFGNFRITEGNWSIVVKNDSIEARGGCFPNC